MIVHDCAAVTIVNDSYDLSRHNEGKSKKIENYCAMLHVLLQQKMQDLFLGKFQGAVKSQLEKSCLMGFHGTWINWTLKIELGFPRNTPVSPVLAGWENLGSIYPLSLDMLIQWATND